MVLTLDMKEFYLKKMLKTVPRIYTLILKGSETMTRKRKETKASKKSTTDKRKLSKSPPTYLKGTARYMWRRLVPLIQKDPNVNNMDRTIVEAFCINYQLMRAAYDDINQNDQSRAVYHTPTNPVTGEEMETEFTGYKRNPSTQILDSATGKLQKLGNELGLTPQSRSELLSLKTDSGTKKDQREQIAKAFDSDNGSTKK